MESRRGRRGSGARTSRSTTTCPTTRSVLGADLVILGIHKIVGSLTQSAMIHLGHGDLIDESVVARSVRLIESTSPNFMLLYGSLDAARRSAAVHGRALLSETLGALRSARGAVREIPGPRRAGRTARRRPRRVRLRPAFRLSIDVRGKRRVSGFELARLLREQNDVHVELAGENVLRRCSEWVRRRGVRPGGSGCPATGRRHPQRTARSAPPPSSHRPPAVGRAGHGPARCLPRPARRWVPTAEAVGRAWPRSRSRPIRRGSRTSSPGVPHRRETLDYIEQTLAHGGSLRGASDRELKTLKSHSSGLSLAWLRPRARGGLPASGSERRPRG